MSKTLKGRERETGTTSTPRFKSTTSDTPPRPKSPVESEHLPAATALDSDTRDIPCPVPPPSDDTDSESYSEHSEVSSLPPSPVSPTGPDPTTPGSPIPDRTPSPIPIMRTVKDLTDALTDKLKDIGRHPTIPLP